ncbi:MAG: VOC family protein, partial [Bryobacteraceae bacterium]
MTNNDFGLSEIGQIAVRVRDIARAVEFYRDKLGMKFLFQAGTLAFFQCGAIRLMLGVPESSKLDHPSSILYFKVQG